MLSMKQRTKLLNLVLSGKWNALKKKINSIRLSLVLPQNALL